MGFIDTLTKANVMSDTRTIRAREIFLEVNSYTQQVMGMIYRQPFIMQDKNFKLNRGNLINVLTQTDGRAFKDIIDIVEWEKLIEWLECVRGALETASQIAREGH